MRVFLDTKSDLLRVELSQGVVAKTMVGEAEKDGPSIEIDLAKGGEVLTIRVAPLAELLAELHLVEQKPGA